MKKHNSKNSKITLFEKNEVLTNYSKIPKTFNNLFKNEVNILNFEKDANIPCGSDNYTNPEKITIKNTQCTQVF